MKKTLITAILIMTAFIVSAFAGISVMADETEIIEAEAMEEYVSSVDIPEQDILFEEYVDSVMYGDLGIVSLDGFYSARDYLSERNRMFFDILKAHMENVASGKESSTVFQVYAADVGLEGLYYSAEDLGVNTLFLSDGSLNPDAKAALASITGFSWANVVDALLMDCPFEMYWYNKVTGAGVVNFSIGKKTVDGQVKICYYAKNPMTLTFSVIESYADKSVPKDSKGRYVATDSANLARVNTARNNAQAVIDHYAPYSDYSKLRAYADTVKNYSMYDSQAAMGTKPYGDPWQLIYVFDGDPDTRVVCEGYSKAFKYLCDLSAFEGNVGCSMVDGYFNSPGTSGRHMWNIVSFNDENRIVDITNYRDGAMFMPVPMSGGSVAFGYSFEIRSEEVFSYTYDDAVKNISGPEVLQLSEEELVIDWDKECMEADHVVALLEAKTATCEEEGLKEGEYCSFCGEVLTPQSVISALGHEYTDEVIKEPSYTEKGVLSHICTRCNKAQNEDIDTLELDMPDGLAGKAAPDGVWYYIKDKRVDTTFSGKAENAFGTWFVENGRVNFSLDGLVAGSDGIWYVKEARIQTGKTDVVNTSFNGIAAWWNVVQGKLLQQETVANNSNGWWYIGEDGKVDFNFKGFAENVNGIWYLENGRVSFNKTDVLHGTVKGVDGWWNVEESRLIMKETVAHNGLGWWYIGEDGKVDFNFKGFAENVNGIWYLENGKVDFSRTDVINGTVKGVDGWWNVEGGRIEKKVTVAHNSYGWWYIGKDGKVDFNFMGIASNPIGTWYLQGGKVNFNYNGWINYGGRSYYINGGRVQ